MFQPVPPPIWDMRVSFFHCNPVLMEFGIFGLGMGWDSIWRGTYIDPDALGIMGSVLGRLLDQLCGDKAEHVLAAAQEALARGVIDASLGLVEALEGVLLAIDAFAAGMGLEEGGVEEAQEGRQRARVLVVELGRAGAPGGCEDDGDEEEDGSTDDDDLGVGVLGQDARGKRSHGTLASQNCSERGEGCS